MRVIIPIIFMIVFLGLFIGANIYMSRRFGYYFSITNLRILYFAFAGITVFMIGGLIGFTNTVSPIGSVLYKLAATFMGVMLYLLFSLVLIDLVSLLVKIKPLVHGIMAIALAISVSGFGVINAYNTKVREIQIPVKGLKEEVTIMHLTDIHVGHFRGVKFLGRLVKKTNSKKPDFIVITGDLFDGKVRLKEEVLVPFKSFEANAYFVDGNHDGYTGVKKVKELVSASGVVVLENQVANEGEIQIVGLNHMLPDSTTVGMHATINSTTIKNTLPEFNIDPDKVSILLHHSPDGIEYADKAGIDLYLAGHTHAGQLFPVNYINDFIFRYNRGVHTFNGTTIYVSPGAGTFGPPMRVGTRSEIAFIKLIPVS